MLARGVAALALVAKARAQQPESLTPEFHPRLNLYSCSHAGGCQREERELVLDAGWRWAHGPQYKNCFGSEGWSQELCPDAVTCAKTCELEGLDERNYVETYGVKSIDGGDTLELDFMTPGGSVGSRLYMLEGPETYKLFFLKNREFTIEVSVEELRCGMNGAIYFVEMDRLGGKGQGQNRAGARYGTGYCDAQCPHAKWIEGEANTLDRHGLCCAEMDIWEANREASAYTPHPCSIEGPRKCLGVDCGDGEQRFEGLCDKDGCDFNPYRMGQTDFYGHGANFTVDTSRPVQVVTQFHTSDGTDHGELAKIVRLYVQDGRVIENAHSTVEGVAGNMLTDELCSAQKRVFQDPDDFTDNGGMAQMGRAMERGMVLAMSLWDDLSLSMAWLDSLHTDGKPLSTPGVYRGPCEAGEGHPERVRRDFADASVRFSKVSVGEIGSTYAAAGRGRRLAAREVHV